MNPKEAYFDVIVCGGGLAGFCAAIAAARGGSKTCLLQDRPVLGGNASSEIRVTIHGSACHHSHARESGIVGELLNAQSRSNHVRHIENGSTNSMQDMAMYDMAQQEANLTLMLNTRLCDVQLEDGSWGLDNLSTWPVAHEEKGYRQREACHKGLAIQAIRAQVANAETEWTLKAAQFIDCTGDALLGHLAGCEWRWGSESAEETGEFHATPGASTDTMGNSIHIRCIDIGRPAPFKAPEWAMHYEDAAFFYEQGRHPYCEEGGFWWIEIGVPYNTITDNEEIRHQLTRHALGVWDWMKNKDPNMMEKCKHYALDFIGQVPGKRESRRILGRHLLNENELQAREVFEDEVAYGGWFIDLHTPGGLLAESSEPAAAEGYNPRSKEIGLKNIGPYGIPLRSLQSKDVPNLMMAGRNISVTHAALGTVRVMATCGTMGQAIGSAAAQVVTAKRSRDEVDIQALKQQLLRDGCFLPSHQNEDPLDLARTASIHASSERSFSGMSYREPIEDAQIAGIEERRSDNLYPLSDSPCQWFPVSGPELRVLGLHLVNQSDETQSFQLRIRKVESLWSYKVEEGELLWEGNLEVAGGFDDVLPCPCEITELASGYLRIELEGPEHLAWRGSPNELQGFAGGGLSGAGRYRWKNLHHRGSFAFRVEPTQAIYRAEQVLSGRSRPSTDTHLWFSDPGQPFPQQLELHWEQAQELSQVELNFSMQLVHEVRDELPYYQYPFIPRDYRIQVEENGSWKDVLRIQDNVESRRQHTLSATLHSRKLRLQIDSSNGANCACVAEIRCYG